MPHRLNTSRGFADGGLPDKVVGVVRRTPGDGTLLVVLEPAGLGRDRDAVRLVCGRAVRVLDRGPAGRVRPGDRARVEPDALWWAPAADVPPARLESVW